MKRAMGCLLLAVLLACLTAVAGLANARMPQRRGALTDDADVLEAQVAADVAEYARRLEDETGIGLHVVLVHFLDGLDARSYANDLFSAWALGEDDLLLLGAAGEDSFAVALGDDVAGKLGRTNAENLLYTSSHFSALFKSQQYDAAMAAFAEALSSLGSRQLKAQASLDGLFEDYLNTSSGVSPVKTEAQSYASELWDEVMTAIQQSGDDYQARQQTHRDERGGMSVGGWLVLLLIVLILFGQSGPARRARRNGPRSCCGCSPLGWVAGLLGLNVFADLFRRRKGC